MQTTDAALIERTIRQLEEDGIKLITVQSLATKLNLGKSDVRTALRTAGISFDSHSGRVLV